MSRLPDGAVAIWATATRICQLDSEGFVDPGVPTFVTSKLIKAALAPVYEMGDDIFLKNAAGNAATFGKKGDIPKYWNVTLETAGPDPDLVTACCGGVTLSNTAAELTTPTGTAVESGATVGTLPKGLVGYRVTGFNNFGETVGAAEVTATIAAEKGTAVIGSLTLPAGTLGARVYGRTPGQEQYLGTFYLFGTQELSTAIAAKAKPTSIKVKALTKALDPGFTFTVTGDTNTPKVVFKVTAFAAIGQTEVQVEVLNEAKEVLLKLEPGVLIPVFVDDGSITPEGHVPATNTTAGPGIYGYQAPQLGVVGNESGVSLEFFEQMILQGTQATDLGFQRILLPRAKGLHEMPKDVTNAPKLTTIEGQAFPNSNWGAGPVGDWPGASDRVYQEIRCGRQVVPVPSLGEVPALV